MKAALYGHGHPASIMPEHICTTESKEYLRGRLVKYQGRYPAGFALRGNGQVEMLDSAAELDAAWDKLEAAQ